MADEHDNIKLLNRLDLRNLSEAADLFAEDFVWHFFNPKLPDVEGDYIGVEGLQAFFDTLGAQTGATFNVDPISTMACGDELVVAHTRNSMTMQERSFAIHAVVVWRVVNGRFAEAWDIPSAFTLATNE